MVAAPTMAWRRLDRSYSSRRGWSSSAENIVGGPGMRDRLALDQVEHRVHLEDRDREGHCPLHQPDHRTRDLYPKQWKNGVGDGVPVVLLQVEGLAEDLVAAQAGTVSEHHALRRSRSCPR